MELTNDMKVLLISDPTTKKAAAALDTYVGNYYYIIILSYVCVCVCVWIILEFKERRNSF